MIQRVFGACVVLGLLAGNALGQFDSATISADVSAFANVVRASDGVPLNQTAGGPFAGFFGGLSVGFSASQVIGQSYAGSDNSQSTTFTSTTITTGGSVNSDIDDGDEAFTSGTTGATSSLTVTFVIDTPTQWSFDYLDLGGVHASSGVSLARSGVGGEQIFAYSTEGPYFKGESGTLDPGSYTFSVGASSFTDRNDGFSGLFADASFSLTFRLSPPACTGDANNDGVVTFLDITTVLANFGTTYSPGTGAGDADANGEVTFLDITTVLANFGNSCR